MFHSLGWGVQVSPCFRQAGLTGLPLNEAAGLCVYKPGGVWTEHGSDNSATTLQQKSGSLEGFLSLD